MSCKPTEYRPKWACVNCLCYVLTYQTLHCQMKVLPVNFMSPQYQTHEVASIWCVLHPCGGHSGTPDIFLKPPDHLSNLRFSPEASQSSYISLMSDKEQTVKTLQSTKCRRLRVAVKNVYFHRAAGIFKDVSSTWMIWVNWKRPGGGSSPRYQTQVHILHAVKGKL